MTVIHFPGSHAQVAAQVSRGRLPRTVTSLASVRRVKAAKEEAVARAHKADRASILEALDGLREAAVRGQIDGMVFIVRVSEEDVRGGAVGSYSSETREETRERMAEVLDDFRAKLPY